MGAFASVPDDCLDKASDWFAKEDFLCQRAVSPPRAGRSATGDHEKRQVGRKYPPGWGQNLRVVRFESTQVRPPPATLAGDDGPTPRCRSNGKGVWARLSALAAYLYNQSLRCTRS